MKYKKGFKYQLAETEVTVTPIKPPENIETKFICLSTNGVLTITAGYAWDGPSGPTIDTENSMTPSLNHDAFAQLMRMKLLHRRLRLLSNIFFYNQCLKRKMIKIRAWFWKKNLDKFGGPSTNPKNLKKVIEVE